ncbi:hypothetical protein Tco_0749631 [Tanacetum coccineum]|uniref:Uncharacterized protein n=1 Tax=Tanacetum coccineum TaxID=301880 RepID=A0ABQ4Z000_9ASTR
MSNDKNPIAAGTGNRPPMSLAPGKKTNSENAEHRLKSILSQGKEGDCYKCRGEGMLQGSAKNQRERQDSKYFKDQDAAHGKQRKGSVNYQLSHDMLQEEQSGLCVGVRVMIIRLCFHQLELERRAKVVPMRKKPKNASQDLHKDILGRSNPRYGKKAPIINASNTWDTDETLASAEVSMAKMKGKPGHVRPENGFFEKLNALKFVPQLELSREHVYWLPANEIASQAYLIAECLERDICSIVLYSDVAVTPSSNCALDGLKVEYVSLKRRYDELSRANTPSIVDFNFCDTQSACSWNLQLRPQWKPTRRHFSLYEMHPLTRIMEPSAETLALSPSVSSSAQITMISRFPDCKFCDPQSGSKGISGRTPHFCDGGLEVAFRLAFVSHPQLNGYDESTQGFITTNLYCISMNDMLSAFNSLLAYKSHLPTKYFSWKRAFTSVLHTERGLSNVGNRTLMEDVSFYANLYVKAPLFLGLKM